MIIRLISYLLITLFFLNGITPIQASEYFIAQGDTISVDILNKKNYSVTQRIAPDGTVSLPFVGRVKAQGKTLTDFQAYLEKNYKNYVQNPQLVLSLKPRPIYIVEKDAEGNILSVKEAQSITKAKALSGTTEPIAYGDIITKQIKSPITPMPPQPIYIIQHNVSKNTWQVKIAKTIPEARAYAGKDYTGTINHGDVITVKMGKEPDFFEDNWYKIVSAVSVITGLVISLSQ